MTRHWLRAAILTLGILAMACGGSTAPTASPAPQQPAAPAQPAPAAPAPEPLPATAPQPAQAPQARPVPPAPTSPAAAPKYGGVLVLVNPVDPPAAYDTMRVSTINLSHVSGALNGDGHLVRPCRDDVYKPCPGVAESWESNTDFTQWIFKIRDGLKWHDGTSFSADDFRFWAELSFYGAKAEGKSRTPSFYKHKFGDMKEVAVLTGNRVRITLGAPDPLYPVTLLEPRNQIAHPRHLMKPLIEKGEVNVAPEDVGWVSIGPFKMLKAEKGVKVQVRRNDLYWEKDPQGRQLPYLDGIDYAILRDPVAQDAAIRVGRADGGAKFPLYTLEPQRKARYVQDLGDKVWFAEVVSFGNDLIFNTVKPGPFQDVRVRKAFSLWYDRQGFIDAVHSGAAVTATLMAPGNPFASPDYRTWPGYNPATRASDREEARRIMAAAGYSEKALQVTFPCRNTRVVICEHVQSAVKGLGIDVRLNILDTAAWTRETRGPSIDFSESGLANAGAFVPEHLFAAIARYSVDPDAVLIRHEDPKMDEFVQQLRGASTSYDQRVAIYRKLERYILLDQVYEIVQARQLSVIPYRSYVKGLAIPKEHLYNLNDFATVWLDK